MATDVRWLAGVLALALLLARPLVGVWRERGWRWPARGASGRDAARVPTHTRA